MWKTILLITLVIGSATAADYGNINLGREKDLIFKEGSPGNAEMNWGNIHNATLTNTTYLNTTTIYADPGDSVDMYGDIVFADGYYARNAIYGISNVADYGAIPGDGNDDYAAFVAAINAAVNGSRHVIVPAGDYNISAYITLPSNLTIDGVPGQTIITVGADNGAFTVLNGTNIYIRGFTIEGNGVGNRVIRIYDSDNITVQDCIGRNLEMTVFWAGSNIVTDDPPGTAWANHDISYRNCRVENVTGLMSYGFFMFATDHGLMDGCTATDVLSSSYNFKGSSNSTIRDCTAMYSGRCSITVGASSIALPSRNNHIINNKIMYHGYDRHGRTKDSNADSAPIRLVECDNSVVSGNTISYSTNTSINAHGNNTIISDNTIFGCDANLAIMLRGDGLQCSGNLFQHINGSGIYNYASNSTFSDNVFVDMNYNDLLYKYDLYISTKYGVADNCNIHGNVWSEAIVNSYNLNIASGVSGTTITGNSPGKLLCRGGVIVTGCFEMRDDILTYWGSGAPGSGSRLAGDIVYNTAPSAEGSIGWVCTTAGSPGTWKTWGSIAA
ncbi:MAG: right-handed parallel beta-helix repeat-containing protein [Sphaerochaeta sp.]|jgi:hypothetical protein|nr:right-handed parallel beta-helix repeat-containing protein [Sphaerochaeta sp.]